MITFPNAKLNLGLHIVSKRADSFHDLETCFYPVPLTDGLEIVPAEKLQFSTSGLPVAGAEEDNLCLKAYRLLQQEFALPPVHLHLHKVIPMGAGLGGGSADAAFTLTALNELFSLRLNGSALEAYARKLGSDCAFFIRNRPVLAYGRGDEMEELSLQLKGYYAVVVYPGLHIGTAEAYAHVKPGPHRQALREALSAPVSEWRHTVSNDFEEALFPKYPALPQLKDLLYAHGAVYAAMTGSGSAVFGLFTAETQLKDRLPAAYSVWNGFL